MTKSSIAKTRRTSSGKTRTDKKSPKNTPAKKVSSRLKPNRKRISKLWVAAGVAMLITAIIVAVYIIGCLMINREFLEEQSKMKNYLDAKYDSSFSVAKPSKKSSGLGIEGVVSAQAYPNNDPSLKFYVMTSSNGVRDFYLSAIWSRAENNRLKENSVVDGAWADINVTVNADYEILSEFRGKPLSYKDMSLKYASKMSYMISGDRISQDITVVQKDRDSLLKLIEYANKQPVQNRTVHYMIKSPDSSKYTVCNLSVKRLGEFIDYKSIEDCFEEKGEGRRQ